jgi:hypothetical protein
MYIFINYINNIGQIGKDRKGKNKTVEYKHGHCQKDDPGTIK